MSRGDVKWLKASLTETVQPASASAAVVPSASKRRPGHAPSGRQASDAPKDESPAIGQAAIVLWALLDDEEVAIDTTRVPKKNGFVFAVVDPLLMISTRYRRPGSN